MVIVKENSPHLRRKATLWQMLLDVLIALSPTVVFALVEYTWRAAVNILLSVSVMVAAEAVAVLIKNWGPRDGAKHSLKEKLAFALKGYSINNFLAPCVSGLIFALILPARETNPAGFIYFVIVVGALFGIVIGKLVFGGTGYNIFNPAAVGLIFVKLCFQSSFSGAWYIGAYDSVSAGGTILHVSSNFETVFSSGYNFSDMFLGLIPGTMGETCKLAILLGLAYLLIRREIDWRVVVGFLGTFLFMLSLGGLVPLLKGVEGFDFGSFILTQLLSGGVLFGVTFMLTDPVTMPITSPSRLLYGMIAAVCVVFIRMFGGYAEGMAFSILIVNMIAPVLDHYKWSQSRFTLKNVLPLAIVPVVFTAILVWALADRLPLASSFASFEGGFVL
ncbi:MAG: RnfABCDGE type electron transport complex subunit D [Bacilli bacterium]|jgi:electron transport complex protein RnfD|nr:RnfABCDGE type electron transport complex subunit D [Bacilli bacterium]